MGMREEFESRYPIPATCEGFNGGFYFYTDIYSGKEKRHAHHQKWLVWQESRAALVIEIPHRAATESLEARDMYHMLRGVTMQLIGTGVTIKTTGTPEHPTND